MDTVNIHMISSKKKWSMLAYVRRASDESITHYASILLHIGVLRGVYVRKYSVSAKRLTSATEGSLDSVKMIGWASRVHDHLQPLLRRTA